MRKPAHRAIDLTLTITTALITLLIVGSWLSAEAMTRTEPPPEPQRQLEPLFYVSNNNDQAGSTLEYLSAHVAALERQIIAAEASHRQLFGYFRSLEELVRTSREHRITRLEDQLADLKFWLRAVTLALIPFLLTLIVSAGRRYLNGRNSRNEPPTGRPKPAL